MWVLISIYVLGLVAFAIHWYLLHHCQKTRKKFIETFLLYQIVFSLGLTSWLAALALYIRPDYVASYTGWPGCPFQIQLGNVNLGYGILGILSIWFRGNFWSATIIGFSVWILGDAVHHIIDSIRTNNFSAGNIGVPLITDIVVPVVLLYLLFLYKTSNIRSDCIYERVPFDQ